MDSERSIRTPWYYPAQGVIFGAILVTAFAAPRGWFSVAAFLGVFAGGALSRLQNAVMGKPSRTWHRESARFLVPVLVTTSFIVAGTWYLVLGQGLIWAAWVGGVVLAATIGGLGLLEDQRQARPGAVTP